MAVFVVVIILLAASAVPPCHQYWKDACGYVTGPCTRRALHFGEHKRDFMRERWRDESPPKRDW